MGLVELGIVIIVLNTSWDFIFEKEKPLKRSINEAVVIVITLWATSLL